MSEDAVPFVAVVGGFYNLEAAEKPAAMATAREIGAALAKQGFGLVVYFSDPGSLEPHVVSGYVAALAPGAGAGRIRVRYPESQRGMVRFAEEETHSEVFVPRIFASQDWEEPFYRSLVEAEGVDAVLLMAGGRSTLIAGHIALARSLPVLAVDSSRGSARVIWAELTRGAPDYPSVSKQQGPEQMVAWLKKRCEAYAKQRAEERRRDQVYQRVTSERGKSLWAGAAFLVLLVVLYFGVSRPPSPESYPIVMFLGLAASGATAALVRAVVWGAREIAPGTSLLLGSVAGFVVGLAYLIPQFVGAPGVLEATADGVQATDKIQFAAAVLIAFSAGIGFDTVFSRLRKQASDVPIGP